ncbi:hypothetical protein EMPS_10686 [Entomortierella parvispora]|uniref:Uncharacterized protein n=1 Tax=Entomortierella parvispora TaxID=205924 RepID=A0A9P3HKH6_9FUNG|nr:hypothetical protein EMPS_10686 [Entomortierella parvispora]
MLAHLVERSSGRERARWQGRHGPSTHPPSAGSFYWIAATEHPNVPPSLPLVTMAPLLNSESAHPAGTGV